MSATGDHLTVMVQGLDRTWEELGANLGVGVVPESVSFGKDVVGGAATMSFTLQRDPDFRWPDLRSFTPVQVWVGGIAVWRGRITRTPTQRSSDVSIDVQCEGLWMHLEDDALWQTFVHDTISEWKDARNLNDSDLSVWRSTGEVSVERGDLMIRLAKGAQIDATTGGAFVLGAVLDLGESAPGAKTIWLDIETSENDATAELRVANCAIADLNGAPAGSKEIVALTTTGAGSSGSYSHEFTTARRFLFVYYIRTADATYSADYFIKVKRVIVATDAAWIDTGTGRSDLTASKAITHVLDEKAPLISDRRDLIEDTLFRIPELRAESPASAREIIERVNSFHRYQFFLTDDTDPVPVFRPIPVKPKYLVSRDDGYEWSASGTNDAAEQFSDVVVRFDDAAGEKRLLRVWNQPVSGWVKLDGSNYFHTPGVRSDLNPAGPFTVEAWAKGGNVQGRIVSSRDPTPVTGWDLHVDGSGFLTFNISDGTTTYVATDPTLWTDHGAGWHHVRALFDGTTIYLVVDGVVVAQTGGAAIAPNTTVKTHIGANSWAGTQLWIGELDEVAIYDYAMNVDRSGSVGDDEVAYATAALSASPRAYYRFDLPNDYSRDAITDEYLTNVNFPSFQEGDWQGLFTTTPTEPDRRGFTRTRTIDARSRMTTAGARLLAYAYLNVHRKPPLKGELKVSGRLRLFGASQSSVPAAAIEVGAGVLLQDERDPLTGRFGRVAHIAKAKYDHDERAATLTLDSYRDQFDALLERIGAMVR